VAVTRARERLYLSWARLRRRGGQLMPGMASRFLDAIPATVSEQRRSSAAFGADAWRRATSGARRPPSWLGEAPAPPYDAAESSPETASQDAPRYVKGERVRHRRFGSGIIRGLVGRGRDLKVEVQFDDAEHGTKLLVVQYAGLERDWE
jgi:DNA helicase-2/ATP-dependent DNA helicase PcrA